MFLKKLRQLLLNAICMGRYACYALNTAKRNCQPGAHDHAET